MLPLLFLVFAACAAARASAAAHPHLVETLPGLMPSERLSDLGVEMYAGHVEVAEGRVGYYWLTRSERDPASDPVVSWQQGGPGCTGISSAWMENGPFRLVPGAGTDGTGGVALVKSPTSWSRFATTLFYDAPVGTGYSTADALGGSPPYAPGDRQTTEDTYTLLRRLGELHPWLMDLRWWIFAESYGGVFGPLLADRIDSNRAEFPLRLEGLAIGNGQWLSSGEDLRHVEAFASRGIVRGPLLERLRACLAGGGAATCEADSEEFLRLTNLVNMYNMGDWCYLEPQQVPPPLPDGRPPLGDFRAPCYDDRAMLAYMRSPAVMEALHAPPGANFTMCQLGIAYTYQHTTNDTRPINLRLVNGGRVRLVVYNGDGDSSEPWTGSQGFAAETAEAAGLAADWTAERWQYEHPQYGTQTGGFATQYGGGRMLFTTVVGAGHLVPRDRPAAAMRFAAALTDGANVCTGGGAACKCDAARWGSDCSKPTGCPTPSAGGGGGACVAPGVLLCADGWEGADCGVRTADVGRPGAGGGGDGNSNADLALAATLGTALGASLAACVACAATRRRRSRTEVVHGGAGSSSPLDEHLLAL